MTSSEGGKRGVPAKPVRQRSSPIAQLLEIFHTEAVMMTLSENHHAEVVEQALSGSSKNEAYY